MIGDLILDKRDLQKRVDELESAEADLIEAMEDKDVEGLYSAMGNFPPEDHEELGLLREFLSEIEDCDDILIHEDYREDYVQQYAGDVAAIGPHANWIKIDWGATADEFFRYDYHSAQIQGHTYYTRNI